MKNHLSLLASAMILGLVTVAASAATIGEPAPEFSVMDSNGETHTLADYEGKLGM